MAYRTILRLDLYPARVKVGGSSMSPVRATITDTELLVWQLGPSGPMVAARYPVTGKIDGQPSTAYRFNTDDGESVSVSRASGCSGCGNRLASADLFPGTEVVHTGTG